MTAVWTWLRWDVRRRWRSLATVLLLTAVSGAVVLTAAAGAHRGFTAPDRLEARTRPADAFVLPNKPHFQWQAVRDLPYVTAVAELAITDPLALAGDYDPTVVTYPPIGPDFLFTVEKPVVLEGRMLDPDAVDEVVVTPYFLSHYDKQVGDHLTLALPAPKEVNYDNVPSDEIHGPRLDVRIVGSIRSPWNYDLPGRPGLVIVSPAIAATYPENVLGPADAKGAGLNSVVNAQVRLEHGAADIPLLRRDLERIAGRSDVDVWDIRQRDRIGRHAVDFESACLAGFAAAALLAALFLVGQGIGRHVAYGSAELPTALAIGATPGRLTMAAAAGPVAAVGTGLVAAVGVSGVASRWFPIGAAARIEPDPGIAVDAPVLLGGAALLLLLAALLALAVGLRTVRAARSATVPRRSRIATAVAGSRLPVQVALGTRFALEPGRGRSAVPVRPALVGAVVGILGTTGVLVFDGAITDAIDNPERFGQTAQALSFVGFGNYDFDPDDKVLHTGVGDTVRLAGDRSEAALHVVGEALMPEIGGTNSYHDGGWVTEAGWHRLFEKFVFRVLLYTGDGSLPADQEVTRLGHEVAAALPGITRQGLEVEPLDLGDRKSSLEQVRSLPRALGIFLILLSVGALGHALAMAVRRRAGEIAVLRALGLTPAQTGGVVATQATVMMLVGLAAGIPLGVAGGRTLWRPVAHYTPLQYAAPAPVTAILLIVPAALAIGVLLAALPARRAARTPAATVLRAE